MPPDSSSAPRERALNIPGLLLVSIALLLAIHAVREWLPADAELRVLLDFAFIPAPWSVALGTATSEEVVQAVRQAGADPQVEAVRIALAQYVTQEGALRPWSALTYCLLHGSWMHVGFNCLWLAAFGTPVVKRAGTARTLVVAVAAALAGALAQWISDPLSARPTVGVSAIVSGLMAAAATFIFARARPAWMGAPAVRRGPDWSFLTNRHALAFLGVWFAINLLFGAFTVPFGLGEGTIAWQAHIGGLLAGLAVFPWLDPGGRGPAISFGA